MKSTPISMVAPCPAHCCSLVWRLGDSHIKAGYCQAPGSGPSRLMTDFEDKTEWESAMKGHNNALFRCVQYLYLSSFPHASVWVVRQRETREQHFPAYAEACSWRLTICAVLSVMIMLWRLDSCIEVGIVASTSSPASAWRQVTAAEIDSSSSEGSSRYRSPICLTMWSYLTGDTGGSTLVVLLHKFWSRVLALKS